MMNFMTASLVKKAAGGKAGTKPPAASPCALWEDGPRMAIAMDQTPSNQFVFWTPQGIDSHRPRCLENQDRHASWISQGNLEILSDVG
jgi:hypothetical protein